MDNTDVKNTITIENKKVDEIDGNLSISGIKADGLNAGSTVSGTLVITNPAEVEAEKKEGEEIVGGKKGGKKNTKKSKKSKKGGKSRKNKKSASKKRR